METTAPIATYDVHGKGSSRTSSSHSAPTNNDTNVVSVRQQHSSNTLANHWHSASLVASSSSTRTTQTYSYDSHRQSSSVHPQRGSLHPDNTSSEHQNPVLRWFQSSTSDQPGSTTTTSSFALTEALNDTITSTSSSQRITQRPRPARLSSAYASVRRSSESSGSVSRSFLLDNFAHSTIPSASLTRPTPVTSTSVASRLTLDDRGGGGLAAQDATDVDVDATGIFVNRSTPSTSSVDALRRVRDLDKGAMIENINPDADTADSSAGPSRWWYRQEHKRSIDNLLDESDQAGTVEDENAKIRKKYKAPQNPLVFCHGLMGFDSLKIGSLEFSHWRGIKEVLEAAGIEVLMTRVPATSSPEERAKVLEKQLSEVYPGRGVHLIGHSMGGLDCRYLTTHLTHRTFRVLSVTTISTPHHGSAFVEHFVSTIGKSRLPFLVSLLNMLPVGGDGDGGAFESLTVENMRRFNEETPDVEGVKYFSWGAECEPGVLDTYRWSHSVIMQKEGPNDGIVSVASAKWGTYLGTLPNTNHADLIGWTNVAAETWAQVMGTGTGGVNGFRPATFYLGLADVLAREVEGRGGGEGEGEGEGEGK